MADEAHDMLIKRPDRKVRPRPHALTPMKTFEQFRVLLSPARVEIYEFLQAVAPCSVAELAAVSGRPADGLYPHLRQLERIGAVEVVDREPKGRVTEAIYDLTGDDVDFDFRGRKKLGDKVISLAAELFIRLGRTALRDAVEAGILDYEKKNVVLRNAMTWLTDDDVVEVRKHALAIVDILDRGRKAGKGRRYQYLQLLVPSVRPGRRQA
ncbi:MAG: helix-turn-helix domain-containing protein [Planctomycetota bacterium]